MVHLKIIVILAIIALFTGCGTTSLYVPDPETMIKNRNTSLTDAAEIWLNVLSPSYKMVLCEANQESGECVEPASGLMAKGLGGLFLPLTMEWKWISVSEVLSDQDKKIGFKGNVRALVNGIAPLCASITGRLEVIDDQTIVLVVNQFYCNWAVIGNVLTSAKFSFDSFNIDSLTATGFYRITFFGTGNARGSGYFKIQRQPHGEPTSK